MRAWRTAAAAALAFAGVVAIATAGSLAAAADDRFSADDGIPIQVTVIPTTPTSTPTPTRSSTPSPTSGSMSRPTSSSPTPSPTPTSGELDTLGTGGSVGGVLYMSGLRAEYFPSIDPGAGAVRASFVLENVSETAIDSSAEFRLASFLGQELDSSGTVYILRLEPGQKRTIEVDLRHPGQWTFTSASVTLTPTTLVDGQRVPSATREAFVVFLPWLILVLAVLGAAAFVIVRVVRARRPETAEAVG